MKYPFARYMMSKAQKYIQNNYNPAIEARRKGETRNRKPGRAGRDRVNHKLYSLSAKQYVGGVNNRVFLFYQNVLDDQFQMIAVTADPKQKQKALELFIPVLRGITNGSLRRYFMRRYNLSYAQLYPRG